MNQLGFVADRGFDAGGPELGRIGFAIIMERVMVGGDQKGRGQTFKIGLTQGLGILMALAVINIAVIDRVFGRKPGGIGLGDIGAFGNVTAQTGIDQNLALYFGATHITGFETQGRSKAAARAITSHDA